QTFGEGLDHARELADPHDTPARGIAHPRAADDWRHVMLAMTFERNARQYDRLVIAGNLRKRLLQDGGRIETVACEMLFQSARHAGRRFDQPISIWIIAGPADDGAKGGFQGR